VGRNYENRNTPDGHLGASNGSNKETLMHLLRFVFALLGLIIWFSGNAWFYAGKKKDKTSVSLLVILNSLVLGFIWLTIYVLWLATK